MKAKHALVLLSLSFIGLIDFVSCQSRSSYCRISEEHTLCQYEGIGAACGQVIARGVSKEEENSIVEKHNRSEDNKPREK